MARTQIAILRWRDLIQRRGDEVARVLVRRAEPCGARDGIDEIDVEGSTTAPEAFSAPPEPQICT